MIDFFVCNKWKHYKYIVRSYGTVPKISIKIFFTLSKSTDWGLLRMFFLKKSQKMMYHTTKQTEQKMNSVTAVFLEHTRAFLVFFGGCIVIKTFIILLPICYYVL